MARFRLAVSVALVAATVLPANAAPTRSIHVRNESAATVDVGVLQPPSATVLERYGTIHPGASLTFTLAAEDARLVVKSPACHGSTYTTLVSKPQVLVLVEKDCKTKVLVP